MNTLDARSEVESKVHAAEQVVRELEAKIGVLNDELGKAAYRLGTAKEFYRLEYGVNEESPLFTMPKRFENGTIREACRQLLKQSSPMHVAQIASAINDGGRAASKTSVTSILVRGREFGRVEGKANTFYLMEE